MDEGRAYSWRYSEGIWKHGSETRRMIYASNSSAILGQWEWIRSMELWRLKLRWRPRRKVWISQYLRLYRRKGNIHGNIKWVRGSGGKLGGTWYKYKWGKEIQVSEAWQSEELVFITNINKSNPVIYKKHTSNTSKSSGVHPRNVRLVQHSKFNHCNSSYYWIK